MRILEYTVVKVLSFGFTSLQDCPHLYDAELTGKGLPKILDFFPVAGSVKNSTHAPSDILWQYTLNMPFATHCLNGRCQAGRLLMLTFTYLDVVFTVDKRRFQVRQLLACSCFVCSSFERKECERHHRHHHLFRVTRGV